MNKGSEIVQGSTCDVQATTSNTKRPDSQPGSVQATTSNTKRANSQAGNVSNVAYKYTPCKE